MNPHHRAAIRREPEEAVAPLSVWWFVLGMVVGVLIAGVMH